MIVQNNARVMINNLNTTAFTEKVTITHPHLGEESVNVIKVGGAVVEDSASLSSLLSQFTELKGKKVLVHGGGRSATKVAASLGIESNMVGGRRITDEEMLRVVTMVYGGLVNKNIVANLQARGVNAIGLTGADMNIIRSHKRPLKKVTLAAGETNPTTGEVLTEATTMDIDYGWVGDVDKVDGECLARLINNGTSGTDAGCVPVVAPLSHDGEGHMLNTNADTIAGSVAVGLASLFDVTLTYCFEKPGVLTDPDDDSSVVHSITPPVYERLKAEGVVSGGMIPKLDNAFEALRGGVRRVVITSASDLEGTNGTTITLE